MKLVMMGTGSFAEPTFQSLLDSPHPVLALVTQPDRAVGQERGSSRLARHGILSSGNGRHGTGGHHRGYGLPHW